MTACYSHEEKMIALTSKTFAVFIRRYLSELGDPPNETRLYNLWRARRHSVWQEKAELRQEGNQDEKKML